LLSGSQDFLEGKIIPESKLRAACISCWYRIERHNIIRRYARKAGIKNLKRELKVVILCSTIPRLGAIQQISKRIEKGLSGIH